MRGVEFLLTICELLLDGSLVLLVLLKAGSIVCLALGELALAIGNLGRSVIESALGGAQLRLGIVELAAVVAELAFGIGELALGVVELAFRVIELRAAVGELALGVVELRAAVGELPFGIGELLTRVRELRLRVAQLRARVSELRLRVIQLAAGVIELAFGIVELLVGVTLLGLVLVPLLVELALRIGLDVAQACERQRSLEVRELVLDLPHHALVRNGLAELAQGTVHGKVHLGVDGIVKEGGFGDEHRLLDGSRTDRRRAERARVGVVGRGHEAHDGEFALVEHVVKIGGTVLEAHR